MDGALFRQKSITPGDGDPRHGTHNGYGNLGCRCPECRKASTAYGYARGHGGDGGERCPVSGRLPRQCKCDGCQCEKRDKRKAREAEYRKLRKAERWAKEAAEEDARRKNGEVLAGEAARILGVSRQRVHQLLEDDTLHLVAVESRTRRWVALGTGVYQYMEEQRLKGLALKAANRRRADRKRRAERLWRERLEEAAVAADAAAGGRDARMAAAMARVRRAGHSNNPWEGATYPMVTRGAEILSYQVDGTS